MWIVNYPVAKSPFLRHQCEAPPDPCRAKTEAEAVAGFLKRLVGLVACWHVFLRLLIASSGSFYSPPTSGICWMTRWEECPVSLPRPMLLGPSTAWQECLQWVVRLGGHGWPVPKFLASQKVSWLGHVLQWSHFFKNPISFRVALMFSSAEGLGWAKVSWLGRREGSESFTDSGQCGSPVRLAALGEGECKKGKLFHEIWKNGRSIRCYSSLHLAIQKSGRSSLLPVGQLVASVAPFALQVSVSRYEACGDSLKGSEAFLLRWTKSESWVMRDQLYKQTIDQVSTSLIWSTQIVSRPSSIHLPSLCFWFSFLGQDDDAGLPFTPVASTSSSPIRGRQGGRTFLFLQDFECHRGPNKDVQTGVKTFFLGFDWAQLT